MDDEIRRKRIKGALLGVALGDALGLPFEGLDTKHVSHLPLERYSFLGRIGFVSDDTEQSALIAQAFARHPTRDEEFLQTLRRSIVGWFLRLPFGLGLGTLKACLRMTVGLRSPGVRSAGNGAAMRAGILGVCLAFDTERRRHLGRRVARLTHTDPRAIEGAVFVAEVAAGALRGGHSLSRRALLAESASLLEDPALRCAVKDGLKAAEQDLSPAEAATRLGSTGFIVHTLAVCTYCFARRAISPIESVRGGDSRRRRHRLARRHRRRMAWCHVRAWRVSSHSPRVPSRWSVWALALASTRRRACGWHTSATLVVAHSTSQKPQLVPSRARPRTVQALALAHDPSPGLGCRRVLS